MQSIRMPGKLINFMKLIGIGVWDGGVYLTDTFQ